MALLAPALALLLGALVTGLTAVATGTAGGASLVGDVVVGGLLSVPAAWVLAGLAVLLSGISVRAGCRWPGRGLGWTVFVLLFADGLGLPGWALGLSPLHHVPAVPLEEPAAGGPLVLAGVAVALVAAGLLAWRRRDVALS